MEELLQLQYLFLARPRQDLFFPLGRRKEKCTKRNISFSATFTVLSESYSKWYTKDTKKINI